MLLGCPLEKVVFGLEPLDMIGYDIKFVEWIREHPSSLAWLIAECHQQVYDAHFKFMEDHIFAEEPTIYDAGLIPFLVTSDYCQVADAHCKVYLEGEKRGMTEYEVVEKSDYHLKIVTSVSKEKFRAFLEDTLNESCLRNGTRGGLKGTRLRLFTGDTSDETCESPSKKLKL